MGHIGREASSMLGEAGIQLSPGLTDDEFASVEERFGFQFNPDHRSLLEEAVPLGDQWPDWRNEDDNPIRRQLDWVAEGFIFDALNQSPPFWGASWGPMPSDPDEVATAVRRELASWPRLVPIFGHRYTPAAPAPSGSPVFSVWQTDIIYYGANLIHYLVNELPPGKGIKEHVPIKVKVPIWSRFVESSNSAESI
ncbi:hypothetical protein [Rhodococcoides kyotonense]|uniref:Knr4/Smi1-like domain-containing protein n=1 Tax=Rhodococcoides kyotonense TaxID=398843 RepID=A0A239J0M5_9NOCA|nr:hypothetical protein [Rhodococcus kyotonensis]SNS99606.1 hypothetical protein SAMN05421642_1082 [Rhodococcus kyotonensis]